MGNIGLANGGGQVAGKMMTSMGRQALLYTANDSGQGT